MKRLYFIDKEGKEHFIMQSADIQALHKACFEDRQKKHIKESPYIRQWLDEKGLWIDYGSWSEFYLIEGATREDICR